MGSPRHAPTNTMVQSTEVGHSVRSSFSLEVDVLRNRSKERKMSKEANLATLAKFAEAVNTGKFDLFAESVAIENIDHDPARGQVPGPEGYRAFFTGLRNAFPDLSVALDTLVADEESIAIAYTMTGTQKGSLMGTAPTGKGMKIRGVQISKFKDGKMVERWGSSDELGMLQQLGAAAASES
jgi:steroid delta-isomerase-like uncharacterized protein